MELWLHSDMIYPLKPMVNGRVGGSLTHPPLSLTVDLTDLQICYCISESGFG